MSRYYLADDQWEWSHQFLLSHPRVYVGHPEHCHQLINAVLWLLRSGSQWRSLPSSYGNWIIDRTIVRAHACAAGANKAMPRPKHWDDQKGGYL